MASLSGGLGLLCVVLTTVAAGIQCPEGGRIHLGSWRCYWLTEVASSWAGARDQCRLVQGGDLASAGSLELQRFIHSSFPLKTTVWIWVKESDGGSQQDGVVDPGGLSRWDRGGESQGGCVQMSLGTPGQWRTAQCPGQFPFLCENDVTEFLPDGDTFVTGLVLMTGVYTETRMKLLPNIPDIGHQTVEIQLFPGVWFSHAGQLVSVQLVVQPSPLSSVARVHVLRPYCSPSQHLVPPGCSSVLNPFSFCSPRPLCNTTGGCGLGQHWCHLTESCLHTSSPCSPYDAATGARGYALPPRYSATAPFYHMVADMPLRMSPTSELHILKLILPDTPIMVYPDDIVAIQHTRNSGTFLHCLSKDVSMDSPWRQSYMSVMGPDWGGWWEGSSPPLPEAGHWVDGVMCDLKILSVDSSQSGAEHNDHLPFNPGDSTTAPDIWTPTDPRSRFELTIIHPVPNENNQIHVEVNVPTLVVIKVLSGERAWSSWSTPVGQSGIPFLPSCPEEVLTSCPGCGTPSPDDWFSSVPLVLPFVGVQTLNISVMDAASSQTVSVKVRGYEAVTGLSIESHGCTRMLVDTQQLFTAKVETGSSVKFSWVIDDLEKFAHEGESYSVVFKKPSDYKIKVIASNPVSSQSEQIFLRADDVTPMADPEFLLVSKVVAVNATNLYTIRVKVDASLPVTFTWNFGDGINNVIHTKPAPCQTLEEHLESVGTQVYVHDSVNFTYSQPDDYTLYVRVSTQHEIKDALMKMRASLPLTRAFISSSPSLLLVGQSLLLEVFTYPNTRDVNYAWDFGDGSGIVRGVQQRVSHTFQSTGFYNITVHANNTLTVLSTWHTVEVSEKISGLAVSTIGPRELNYAANFMGSVTTGTSLTWTFDFGDGSLMETRTDGSVSHVYKSPGVYTVKVAVLNSVSQAHVSVTAEVPQFAVSGILPSECVASGRDTQLAALVNGNVSALVFHWLFGDGSSVTVMSGTSVVTHTFQTPGSFHIGLTVLSSVTSTSFDATLCVEVAITNITIWSSQEVAAVGAEVCFQVFVFPKQVTGYQLQWLPSPSSLVSRTENTQRCFVFRDEGVAETSVRANNSVSVQTAGCRVTLQKPVQEFSVAHDIQRDALKVGTAASFWVASCVGSNVSLLWDFGDGSPLEQTPNVSHVFTASGNFTVTATAFNAVSRDSVAFWVNVVLPVSDLSIRVSQPYGEVGEETVFTAVSSAISNATYFWIIDAMNTTILGTCQLRFTFKNPGVYKVRVRAETSVITEEAAITVQLFERIEGLQIDSETIINMKYVPTRENLLFVPSVTKGSNVTFHWSATHNNQEVTRDGDSFQTSAETPGRISIHVTASNSLGEARSSLCLEAQDRAKGARITAQSSVVALGELVNISASVASGSGLKYLWHVEPNHPPVETSVPFLLHVFTSVAHFWVNVSVQNAVSQSNVTKDFTVQQEVREVDFEIDKGTHPFYVPTRCAVTLRGFHQEGSDLTWSWTIGEAIFNEQTNIYSFPHAGIYQVSLNVSNRVNWQDVSHTVTVQDPIEELVLKVSKFSSCSGEEVTFVAAISSGSNASFLLTFRNGDWSDSRNVPGGLFTTSSLPSGTVLVTVKSWNQVSSAEVSSTILITEGVQGLRIANSCSGALEAEKGIFFKSETQSRVPVNYTWMFHLVGFEPVQLRGQEVFYAPPGSGSLLIRVLATDGVCYQSVNSTATVQWPVESVKLVPPSDRIFVDHPATFRAEVSGRGNASFLWDFGDSADPVATDSDKLSHTYRAPGKYSVRLRALNDVSATAARLHVEVEVLQCSSPQVSLVHSWSTIIRSRSNYFEASVVSNCSAYNLRYLWEVLTLSQSMLPGNKVRFKGQEAMSPTLLIPKHTLGVGRYRLLFTASLQGTPLRVQRDATITVVDSPLAAVIKGGSKRLWPSLTDLTLDGSESQDLDQEPGEEDALNYDWTFVALSSSQSLLVKKTIESKSSRVTVPSSQLQPGTGYIFTLTVHKMGRTPASVNQTVVVCEAPVTPVTLRCVSCSVLSSSHRSVSHTLPVLLSGHCDQCDAHTQYTWAASDQAGRALDLQAITSPGDSTSASLELLPGVLQPGQSYTFTVNVSHPDGGLWGSADVTVRTNAVPHGGRCHLSPESDLRLLETLVTVNCGGWKQTESSYSQLIYTFQVEACDGAECPPLTLYKGTRSTFASLLPGGRLGPGSSTSTITATLLIEDQLGSKIVALRKTLTVRHPVRGDAASRWLANKSQTELHAAVRHGNPQEVIPFTIALTSQLNQLDGELTINELMDRREIRRNVTRALASLPVSSLLDVDQMTSALLQSTAVPSELGFEDSQREVLEAVGKVIRAMEEHAGPGLLSPAETGRSILKVIGNALAASKPVTPPGSSSSSSVLSALGLAATLTLSLVRSHGPGPGPAPVSLWTPSLDSVGFRGDPAHLVCTDQSDASSSCRFHIPSSFAAHLRSQESEVVQVLLGVRAEMASDPLVAAADPPISTALVAMELSTPQGRPIAVQDLDPGQAIRVTLPIGGPGSTARTEGGGANATCLAVSLPAQGSLNFTVGAVDRLVDNAGLYISFTFSLDPGVPASGLGHVKIEVSAAAPAFNASQVSLVRECSLRLSDPSQSTVESIFLSPLWDGTGRPLSVNLTSSLVGSGPVRASLCVFSSVCRYYSPAEGRWRSDGLRPLEGSTLREAHCLSTHLTVFGASVFVHPGAVVLLPPSSGPERNMTVALVCAVLLLIHLVVGIIAHKMDYLDSLRLRQVPLCSPPGLYQYRVLVKTGWTRGSGTTAHVGISLYGGNKSGCHHLQRDGAFQRGGLDQFHLETDDNLGEIWKIRIWHDNTGLDPSWFLQHVVVWDSQTDHMFFFLLEDWLSVDNHRNGTVEKEVLASCPEELSGFSRVFTSQLLFGAFEHHLWVSLWDQRASSCSSRGQRVACCALALHLYLALLALWYGAVGTPLQGGPVSSRVPVNLETVAVGMTVAVLVFPLQTSFCFLFRKTQSRVTVDTSPSASPVCHSVEMDVQVGRSDLSGSSFLSLPDSSQPISESHSSLLDSKLFDSSILHFWAASGLAPPTDGVHIRSWPSYDSLLNTPAGPELPDATPDPQPSPVLGHVRQLRRKKALAQLRLAPPLSAHVEIPLDQNVSIDLERVGDLNLATALTRSEENLMMSIAADNANSGSDSGRGSPRTPSSLSNTWCASCSSWPEQQELKPLWDEHSRAPLGPQPGPCSCQSGGLHRRSSLASVDSMASTFLPSVSPDSTRSPSTTRIGVARGQPGWLLPSWALRVIYPAVGALSAACLAVVLLYGSLWPRNVVLLWLISTSSAFLTSTLLLEPLKVCVQALICTTIWRPVDPEVEDHLALETTVVRTCGAHGRRVLPPYGYGLLRARREARKVQTLRSLMKRCLGQLLLLLLLLLLNHQDRAERRQARLLRSAIARSLPAPPSGTSWSEVSRWVNHTLVPHLHRSPLLSLVGSPRLRDAAAAGRLDTRRLTFAELSAWDWSPEPVHTLSLDFTHHHREAAVLVCVSLTLSRAATHTLDVSVSARPLLLPPSSGPDLQTLLAVLLLLSGLLAVSREVRSVATERGRYFRRLERWVGLVFASLSLTSAVLHFCFLSRARSCVSEHRSGGDASVCFHHAARLERSCSQSAAVLLTLLTLKLLAALSLVRRWMLLVRALQRSWRQLWALAALLASLLLGCLHLGVSLFSHSVEGFSSLHHAGVSVLSMLRGQAALSRLCRVHPGLGPLFGLLLTFGGVWCLAKLCGAVLISSYRAEKSELHRPTTDPQDHEMVDFFIRRLKLWLGLTKAKEFRHSVKFEGLDMPPSRLSLESHFSTSSSSLPSSPSPSRSSSLSSPRASSSALSERSEDQPVSQPGPDVRPYLGRLLPCVNALLSRFDQVNQVTEDVHVLEVKLEEALSRRQRKLSQKEDGATGEPGDPPKAKGPAGAEPENREIRRRKVGVIHPRVSLPSSFSFSPSTLHWPAPPVALFSRKCSAPSESDQRPTSSSGLSSEVSGGVDTSPAAPLAPPRSPRRRAWHSGSSHPAEAAQRASLAQDGPTALRKESCTLTSAGAWNEEEEEEEEEEERGCLTGGVPVKRKAWA